MSEENCSYHKDEIGRDKCVNCGKILCLSCTQNVTEKKTTSNNRKSTLQRVWCVPCNTMRLESLYSKSQKTKPYSSLRQNTIWVLIILGSLITMFVPQFIIIGGFLLIIGFVILFFSLNPNYTYKMNPDEIEKTLRHAREIEKNWRTTID